jgi:primosomal protein N'
MRCNECIDKNEPCPDCKDFNALQVILDKFDKMNRCDYCGNNGATMGICPDCLDRNANRFTENFLKQTNNL